jgi:hypothetical protein
VKCRDIIFCAREGLGQIRQKNVVTRYTEIAFLCPVGFVGHVVHSIASGPQNIDAVFFMLRWAWYGFHKMCVWTCYVELVFLHTVGYAGHVVHLDASGVCNIDAVFSCLGGTDKYSTKRVPGHVTPNLRFCIRWDL